MKSAVSMFADVRIRKAALFAVGCLPMLGMFASLLFGSGGDPYEQITHTTGEFSMRFMILTLAVTPLIAITGWRKLGPFRRTLGVLAFTYVVVHFAAYVVYEAGFDPLFLLEDIPERNFIAVGLLAFLLMLPLGLTSNNLSVRLLGGKRWKKLHWLAYPLGILACVHYLLLSDELGEPLVHLGIVVALLGFRLAQRRRQRQREQIEASAA